MTVPDAVRALLRARGCPDRVVTGGLPALIDRWDAVVLSVEEGYGFTLDDYLNDMDLRDLIAAALHVADPGQRDSVGTALEIADTRLRAHTVDCGCLWGDDIALEEDLAPQREWWYFRRPTRPGDQLRDDLEMWGLRNEE